MKAGVSKIHHSMNVHRLHRGAVITTSLEAEIREPEH